jgi:hypothetical protein
VEVVGVDIEQGTIEQATAVDGDGAVATGNSTYRAAHDRPIDKAYDNCFVLRFDVAGSCREFTEWYIQRPALQRTRRPSPDGIAGHRAGQRRSRQLNFSMLRGERHGPPRQCSIR